jgi:hypothetical protein
VHTYTPKYRPERSGEFNQPTTMHANERAADSSTAIAESAQANEIQSHEAAAAAADYINNNFNIYKFLIIFFFCMYICHNNAMLIIIHNASS